MAHLSLREALAMSNVMPNLMSNVMLRLLISTLLTTAIFAGLAWKFYLALCDEAGGFVDGRVCLVDGAIITIALDSDHPILVGLTFGAFFIGAVLGISALIKFEFSRAK